MGPVIELAQAQMLVLNQTSPGLGVGVQPGKALAVGPLALGAGTGVHQAAPWPWPPIQLGKALAVGAGDRAGVGAALGFNQASPGRGRRC